MANICELAILVLCSNLYGHSSSEQGKQLKFYTLVSKSSGLVLGHGFRTCGLLTPDNEAGPVYVYDFEIKS